MREYLDEESVIQFLLKSFRQGEWKFNLPAIKENYESIIGWETVPAWDKPVLLIPGGNSLMCKPNIEKRLPHSSQMRKHGSSRMQGIGFMQRNQIMYLEPYTVS